MATKDKASDAFTAEEKAAMQEHAKAEKAAARKAAKGDTNLEPEVLAKIADLPEPDRSLATRVHEIVKAAAEAGSRVHTRRTPFRQVVSPRPSRHPVRSRFGSASSSETSAVSGGYLTPSDEEARLRRRFFRRLYRCR